MGKVRVEGAESLRAKLEAIKAGVHKAVGQEVAKVAYKIEAEAKTNCPANFGDLRQSGFAEISMTELKAKVAFSSDYAPYIEFGTGTKVSVPSGFEEMAREASQRARGNWKEFKDNIQAWMRAKGIDLKYTYPIMLSIYENGIPAQPFLIPAYLRHAPKLKQNIKDRLKNEKF